MMIYDMDVKLARKFGVTHHVTGAYHGSGRLPVG